ncbi:hypothetical protein CBR_g34324 [Chara braunii]|uniref:Uncharacterized protein n=1 Tax=Chara braunii TaxID=69332 RepID=A0A388LIH8_CHABU|nr:hypothetical protein CBR_g34324 [Chara braunii]|eukprot:GBG82045.1 hypothetical protein CBR_g34324 [Chara braunii]
MEVAPVFRGTSTRDGTIAWRSCAGTGNGRGAGNGWEAASLHSTAPGNDASLRNASVRVGGDVTIEALKATVRWEWPSHRIMREWRQNVRLRRSGEASPQSRQYDVTTRRRGGRGCRTARSRPSPSLAPSLAPSLNLGPRALSERPRVFCRPSGSIERKRSGRYGERSRSLARASDCNFVSGSAICVSRMISLGGRSPTLVYSRTMIANLNPKLNGDQAGEGKRTPALHRPHCKHERDPELAPHPDAEPHPDHDPYSSLVTQDPQYDHVAAGAANVGRLLTIVNDAHSHGSVPSPSPPFPPPPSPIGGSFGVGDPVLPERDHTVSSLAGVPASSHAEGTEFAQSYGAQLGHVSSSEGGVVGTTTVQGSGGASSAEIDAHHRIPAKNLGAALHSARGDAGSECSSGLGSAAASVGRHPPQSPPVASVLISDGLAECPRPASQTGPLPRALRAASASSDLTAVSVSASALASRPTLGTCSSEFEFGFGAVAPWDRSIFEETLPAGAGFGSASSRDNGSAGMSGAGFERGSHSDPDPGFPGRVSEPFVMPPGPETGPGGSLLEPGSHEDLAARPLRRQNCSSKQWEDLLSIPDRLVRDIGFAIACPCLLLNSEEVPIVDELVLGSSGSAWTSMIQWLKGLDSPQVAEWFAAKKRTRLGDHFADCMEYALRFSPYFRLDHLWVSQPVHWRTMQRFHHGPKVRIQQGLAENADVSQDTNTSSKDFAAPDNSQCNVRFPKDTAGEADEIHQALDVVSVYPSSDLAQDGQLCGEHDEVPLNSQCHDLVDQSTGSESCSPGSESCSPGPEVSCHPASRQDCDGNDSACIPDNVRNQGLSRDLQELTLCSSLTSATKLEVSSGSPGYQVREMQPEMEGSVTPFRTAVVGNSLVNTAASVGNSCHQDGVQQGSIAEATLLAGVRLTEHSEPVSHGAMHEADESAEVPSVLSSAANRASLAPADNIGRHKRRGRGRGEITKTIGEFDILFVKAKAVGAGDEGAENMDSFEDGGSEAPGECGKSYRSNSTGNPLIVDSMECQISAEGMVFAQPGTGDVDCHSDRKAVDGKLQSAAASFVPRSDEHVGWEEVYDESTSRSGRRFKANASIIPHASVAKSGELTEKRDEDTTVQTAGWQDRRHDIDSSNDGRSGAPASCSGPKAAVEMHHWELSVKYFLFCVPDGMDRGEGEEEKGGEGRQELQGGKRGLVKMTNFFGPHAEEILSSRKDRLHSQVRLSADPRAWRFLAEIYAKAEEERKLQQEADSLTDARAMIARSFTETASKSGVYLRMHSLQTTLQSGLREGSEGELPASAGSSSKGTSARDSSTVFLGRPHGFGKGFVGRQKGSKSKLKKDLSANKPERDNPENTKADSSQQEPSPQLSHLQSLGRLPDHLSNNLMIEEAKVVNVVPSSEEEGVSFAPLDNRLTLGVEQKDRTVPIYMDHPIHTVQGVHKADYREDKGEGGDLLGLQGDIDKTVCRADEYESEPDHTTALVTSSRLSGINEGDCLMQAMQEVNTADCEGCVGEGNNMPLLVHEGDTDGGAVSATDKKEEHPGRPAVMVSATLSGVDKSVKASRDVELVLSTGKHAEVVETTLDRIIKYEIIGPGVVRMNELANIQVWAGAVSKGYLFYEYNLWVELQKQDWERGIAQLKCRLQMENGKPKKLGVHSRSGINEIAEQVDRNNQERKNAELNPNHWKGWWTRDIRQLILQPHHHDSRWYIISKMEWLAPIVVHATSGKDAAPTGVLDSDQLMERIEALAVEAEKGGSPRKRRALVAELRWRGGLVGACGDNLGVTDQRPEGLSLQGSSQNSQAAVSPEVRGEDLNRKGAWVEVSRGFVVEKTWRETDAGMPCGLSSIDSGGRLATIGCST